MSDILNCPICDGNAESVEEEYGIICTYQCEKCGHQFAVRIHYLIDDSIQLDVKEFKAFVEVPDVNSPQKLAIKVKKLAIKVKKTFSGHSNFSLGNLESQINDALSEWDLGFYSEKEVSELKKKAAKLGLNIKFVLIEDTT